LVTTSPYVCEVIGRAAGIESVAEVLIVLREQRVDHRQAYAVDCERQPPASVASVDYGPHPDPTLVAKSIREQVRLSGSSSTMEYTVWPANRFFALAGDPIRSGSITRAVLERVPDRVQHIGLNPERVSSLCPPRCAVRLGVAYRLAGRSTAPPRCRPHAGPRRAHSDAIRRRT
jgi:hypothetical protein